MKYMQLHAFECNFGKLHSDMAKLHSASPREITWPFPHTIVPKLHSKACNYLY